jgi:hypothetical protein
MEGTSGAWIEVRVDGITRRRFDANDLDEAAATTGPLLDASPSSVIEVVRCTAGGEGAGTIMLLRYAPAQEDDEPMAS